MTSREWLPQQAAFEFVRRGYSPEQVNEYLDRLEYDLRILTADRDSANHRQAEVSSQLQAAQSEADELRNQLDRTAMTTPSMSGLSERMQRMIRLAEEESSEIRARAQAEAADQQADLDKRAAELAEARRSFEAEREKARGQLAQQVEDITHEAQTEAERVRGDANHEAATIVGAAQNEAQRLVGQANDYLTRTTEHAQALADAAETERIRLDTEAQTRRKEIEDDFTIAITARRTQAHQYVAEQERESDTQAEELIANAKAEAQRLVDEAGAEAQRRVDLAAQESRRRVVEADLAVDQLVDLRSHVLGQLSGLQPYLARIQEASDNADELLRPRGDEATKPGGDDFDPEVAPLDFDSPALDTPAVNEDADEDAEDEVLAGQVNAR